METVSLRLWRTVSIVVVALFAFACGKQLEELKNVAKVIENAPKAAEQMQKSNDVLQKRMEERRAKGDTLALHYTKLQEYLPTVPSGYTAEKPTGETTNMMGMSYSRAGQIFTKGKDNLELTIVDYNQAYGLYQSATALWSLGMSIDNDSEISKSYSPGIEFVNGWESFKKHDHRAELFLGVGGRFWIEAHADNQHDMEMLKSIVKSMKLDAMSKM